MSFDASTFTGRMEAIARLDGDPEASHLMADDLMVTMLRHLGYEAAMDAYVSMTRWYA